MYICNMKNEIYKEVIGYKGLYEVSNFGNVKRMKKLNNQHEPNTILKPFLTSAGYTRVQLFLHGKKRNHFIHRLVAMAFLDNPMKKTQVNHINGDKVNNNLSNLEWSTPSENGKHSYKVLGRTPMRKVDVLQVESIRNRYVNGEKLTHLAKEYNVSPSTIWNICIGNTYMDYPGPIIVKGQKGSGNGSTILTEAIVLKIRELHLEYSQEQKPYGYATWKVGKHFEGVSPSAIRHIISRRTWKHI